MEDTRSPLSRKWRPGIGNFYFRIAIKPKVLTLRENDLHIRILDFIAYFKRTFVNFFAKKIRRNAQKNISIKIETGIIK